MMMEFDMNANYLTEIVTDANFDEDRYLAANPDIKRAGVPARLHFDLAGRNEGRIQFRLLEQMQDNLESIIKSNGKIKNFNGFSTEPPSHQAGLDLWKGDWMSAMPSSAGLAAGQVEHFNDERVEWADPLIGGVAGKAILELGPFEAYNSYQFDRLGARKVLSIENSPHNFLKCLLVKNVFGLKTEFLLGDFNKYRPPQGFSWDVVWASGVLYHLVDPIGFLDRITGWGDRIFLWTQYFDGRVLTACHPEARLFDAGKNRSIDYGGRTMELHHRSYPDASSNGIYAGGLDTYSYWMELDDILHVLRARGFARIEIGVDNPGHPLGPACYLLAFRDDASGANRASRPGAHAVAP